MAITLQHQTVAEFLARFRAKYRRARREELARLARFLANRYQAGDITEAQIRTMFGIATNPEWNAFRDKVIALRDGLNAVEAAEGE